MAPPPLKKTKMGPRSARRLEGVATAWNVVALGLEARGTWRLSSAAVSWRVAVRLPVRRCFEASVGQSTRRWADCQEATGAQTLSRRRSRDNSATIVASENPRVYGRRMVFLIVVSAYRLDLDCNLCKRFRLFWCSAVVSLVLALYNWLQQEHAVAESCVTGVKWADDRPVPTTGAATGRLR